ncbi:MAG: hypothetical protein IJG65_07780 [Synergistaceae bacterium]|nr:hypothetical protein [Synergistaceae bacterium]
MTPVIVSLIAIAIAFLGVMITLVCINWELYRDARKAKNEPPVTRSEVSSMIDEAISRALGTRK